MELVFAVANMVDMFEFRYESDPEDLDDERCDDAGWSDVWEPWAEEKSCWKSVLLLVPEWWSEVPFWERDWVPNVSNGLPFEAARLVEFSLDTFEECWWESGNDGILEVCFDTSNIKTNDLYFSHKH